MVGGCQATCRQTTTLRSIGHRIRQRPLDQSDRAVVTTDVVDTLICGAKQPGETAPAGIRGANCDQVGSERERQSRSSASGYRLFLTHVGVDRPPTRSPSISGADQCVPLGILDAPRLAAPSDVVVDRRASGNTIPTLTRVQRGVAWRGVNYSYHRGRCGCSFDARVLLTPALLRPLVAHPAPRRPSTASCCTGGRWP